MHNILIIEDDQTIAGVMQEHLQSWGHTVCCADVFQDIIPQLLAFDPQLVLLDISLPGRNGFHWCQEIRKLSKVPVIFVSSAGDNMNQVMAMNFGGDDFITKPFDLQILAAKVQALLRRTYEFDKPTQLLQYRDVVYSAETSTVHHQGRQAELTKNEARILQLLMQRPGKIVTRSELMQRLWEHDSYVDDNTLTVNMTRLRTKLGELGIQHLIHTKKGEGYQFE